MRQSWGRGVPTPAVDKNPFYTTNAILNSVYNCNMRLLPGDVSQTDCLNFVMVNFSPTRLRKVEKFNYMTGGKHWCTLECGHEVVEEYATEGNIVDCKKCAQKDAYTSFMHEWFHRICKSNPRLAGEFSKAYVSKLVGEGYNVINLYEFIFMIVNAFDDLRTLDLGRRIYEGSAWMMSEKWKRLCEEDDRLNDNFVSFIFGVALKAENLNRVDGRFTELIPIVEDATERVKGKGMTNSLVIVRLMLERCIDKLVDKSPPPPPMPQPDPAQGQQAQQPQDGGQPQQSPDGKPQPQQQGQQAQSGQQQGQGTQIDKGDALDKLTKNAKDFVRGRTPWVPKTDKGPINPVAVQHALSANLDDIDKDAPDVSVDQDMADAIAKMQTADLDIKGRDHITSTAKAKIKVIDVRPRDINPNLRVEVTEEDRVTINRLRAAFAKALGRMKARRDTSGMSIDIEEAIQYVIDPQNDEIFEVDKPTRGFAYAILCDMSGSMSGSRFEQVCKAANILKRALDYPFVEGILWGFRGAFLRGPRGGMKSKAGEIWLYKYHENCDGYIGRARMGNQDIPVECHGLTPMNPSLHVVVKHLHTQVAAAMTKRIFVLTDGSPTHTKISGESLSRTFLKKMVRKEVQNARSKNIQIFTIIIGRAVSDDDAILMFGPRRYWRRVTSNDEIDRALSSIVLENFVKHLGR